MNHHSGLRPDPHCIVVRVEAGLFFANSDYVRERIHQLCTPLTRLVVLDAETSPFIDITAAQMLVHLADALRLQGIELRIARDVGQFRDVMHSAESKGLRHNVYRTIDEALTADPVPGSGEQP